MTKDQLWLIAELRHRADIAGNYRFIEGLDRIVPQIVEALLIDRMKLEAQQILAGQQTGDTDG